MAMTLIDGTVYPAEQACTLLTSMWDIYCLSLLNYNPQRYIILNFMV